MRADYHVHSEYSDDSIYKIEDIIKDAIEKGLDEICITDHVDYGIKDDWDSGKKLPIRDGKTLANVDYPKFFDEITQLKEKYKGQIIIKKGMEFGVQTHTIENYERLFETYPYDFIILSIHQVNNKEFWNNEYQQGKTEQELYHDYYEEMYNVVQNYHNYSVLGHMDLICRYDYKDGYPAFKNHKEQIEKILKYIIKDGKGIELNTSSKHYGLNDLTPSRDILKLYKQLGGTILTIGSDTHVPNQLNAYIDEAKVELKKLGFTKFCTFENMEPIFHAL